MKTKILIILIVLIGLGIGGFFVYKNISAPEVGEKEVEKEEVPAEVTEKLEEEEALTEEKEEPIKSGSWQELKLVSSPPSSYQLEVPHYQEKDFCYGASALMIARYWGLSEEETQNLRQIIISGDGLSGPSGPPRIIPAFGKLNLNSLVYLSYLKDSRLNPLLMWTRSLSDSNEQVKTSDSLDEALLYLKRLIASKIPVMVVIEDDLTKKQGEGETRDDHFTVVVGYDKNNIYTNDPSPDRGSGVFAYPTADFLKRWDLQGTSSLEAAFLGDYGMIFLKPKKEEPATKSIYNWPMMGGDSNHTGFSESEAPDNENIFLNLNFPAGDVERDVRGLVFESNRLYFAFDDFIYAVNALSGNKIWQTNLGGLFNLGWSEEAIRGLAIADGKLFVSRKSGLYALDAETGGKLWSYKAGDKITAPTVADGKVYFGSDDDYFYALKFDGKLDWRFQTQGNIHSIPAVSNDRVCFGTEDTDWSVYCLNVTTGEVLWRHQFAISRETPGGMFHAPATIFENLVLIGEEGGGRGIRTSGKITPPAPSNFYALDINNGEVVWSFKATDWIVKVAAVAYNKVYFSSWDGNIYALDIKNGELLWKARGGESPAVADGKVFTGSEEAIFAYDAETGKIIWSYPTEDIPTHLIIAEGKLYAGFTNEDVVHTQVMGFGK